jgi:hypothetical protein
MKFIRKNGRIIPIRESRAKTIARSTADGAKVGGTIAGSVLLGNALSDIAVNGYHKATYKFVGKALGAGIAVGAGLGALYGATKRPRKKK